ncbi:Gfo/Idh/MocA family oxidoreductase [Cohnella ginsengisoli]|uniref:Gfo/Idh/MocA family oxidoreductase n=1 Tax=Cohnella ginsengisoli TaxID=425004 RepID=A0A9X4KIP0_9BACL|nr:Gfo/Idh/MocA family oxidoreductase [Cohnella ginsengisoli]MDG0792541.1 Gfo/Idh/MocA family oxidoreductase [Cohnella ginsengisoli]
MSVRKALLIGAGGFGRVHLNELVRLTDAGLVELAAISDVRLTESAAALVAERGIRHYADYRDMLSAEAGADFVVISTPIPLHAPMSIGAMEAGYHVLLEKPPGALLQDVDRIAETASRTGKLCAVNFFAPSRKAQSLIAHAIASGEIGRVKRFKAIALLQRTAAYYGRTPWAGKLTAAGNVVLDGAFHNPAAHLLYSMLKLAETAADAVGRESQPVSVAAEMYHANPIESDDTTAMRIEMSDGTPLCYYVTLCAKETETQRVRIEGTEGAIEWNYDDQVRIWRYGLGKSYDCAEGGFVERRYRNLIRSIDGQDGLDVSLDSARRFTLVANGAFESAGVIRGIPPAFVRLSDAQDQPGAYIEGIETAIKDAFAAGKLLSETGLPWAAQPESFDLRAYRRFPQRFRMNGA